MFGERLHLARKASGLSMKKLADAVGVSANMIKKYEHNQSIPSSSIMLKLADVLSTRVEFFFRAEQVTLEGVEYRKKSSAPKRLLAQIEANVTDQAERWLELKHLWANFPIPDYHLDMDLPSIQSFTDIELIAKQLRQYWQLGLNPIPNLIDTLESKGILVIVTEIDFDTHKNAFDGLQASINHMPVIVVAKHWTGDRQRFTLAHELGHLVLHGHLPDGMDEEKACNRFAGSFLLPEVGVIEHLGKRRSSLLIKELGYLKHEYGLSMCASLYRAKDVSVISETTFKSMMICFSQKGWRKQEPDKQYPTEQTYLFEQLVYRALAEQIISESKAAELLKLPLIQLQKSKSFEIEEMQITDAEVEEFV